MPTFFKAPRVAAKVRRKRKYQERQQAERGQMDVVRQRDRFCRFPLCRCANFRLQLEVSHQVHRGSGGNPAGDRSDPALMLLLCSARHRENIVSVDRGSVRWREIGRTVGGHPLVAWDVDRHALEPLYTVRADPPEWVEVAREAALHVYEPLTAEQRTILRRLAEMEL